MHTDASVRPTVGRDSELELLDAALDALAESSLVCVAFEGEPGIGKTRLLAELRDRAEARGCLVLAGSATEFERDLPFSVWVDALDAYVASQELRLQVAWDAEAIAELAAVFPSLATLQPGSVSSVADERYRAHRAVRRLLELLAADRPLVLLLDDLHWSDGASIELLGALLRRGPDADVLLALAFRPTQAPARLSAALTRFGSAADRARAAQRGGGDGAAGRARPEIGGGDLPARRRQPLLPRAARAGGPGGDARGVGERRRSRTRSASRAAVAAVARRGARVALRRRSARCSRRRLWPASRSSPTSQRRSPSCPLPRGSPRSTRCSRATSCARRTSRAASSSATRSYAAAVYESAPGGWRLAAHARAAAELAARGAAPAERAHHVEQSAEQGDEEAIAAPARGGRSGRDARSRCRGALVRGGAAAAARR